MSSRLTQKSIFKKIVQVGGFSIFSKLLGLVRTMLASRFLGAGMMSDAFWIAFKIPNILRKTFAEGALSAALVPTFSELAQKGDDDQISKLSTLVLIIVSSLLLVICVSIAMYPMPAIVLIAPGFKSNPVQLETAVSLLRILIFFILFISASALLAGAQQAKNHFLIPSWGPILLNTVFITGLIIGLFFGISMYTFAGIILLGGAIQLALNMYMYCRLGFSFCLPGKECKTYPLSFGKYSCSVSLSLPDKKTRDYFFHVFLKFVPCVITMSIVDINLLIDNRFASFLPAGSISVIEYSTGFFRIPLSALGVTLSTILLTHLSRTASYAPKRLSYYLLESTKFIFWLAIPTAFFMSFVSYKIFYTILLSSRFTIDQVNQASLFLTALLVALPCFSLNKVISSVYYSVHSTVVPAFITLTSAGINIICNIYLSHYFGLLGLSMATAISTLFQAIISIIVLHKYLGFKLYVNKFMRFMMRFAIQFALIASLFMLLYYACAYIITYYMTYYSYFLLHRIGYWLWVGPLVLSMYGLMYISRRFFGINIYYIK
jgi:putative peptidoglycan lipid II flippase